MELTRFDLQNQSIQRRIADALERIATVLEKLTQNGESRSEDQRIEDVMQETNKLMRAYLLKGAK